MSNEKTVYTLHPFVEWAHKTGRIFMICFSVWFLFDQLL